MTKIESIKKLAETDKNIATLWLKALEINGQDETKAFSHIKKLF